MSAHFRRCGPCHTSFQAPTEEAVEALLQEHRRQSHPEVHAIGLLVERLDRLIEVMALREAKLTGTEGSQLC